MRAAGFRGVIVGVTGALLPEEVDSFFTSGADVVIAKPVDLKLLQRDICRRTGGAVAT